MSIQTLVWLFMIAFVIHDLEEVIAVEPWLKRNRDRVMAKVPNRMKGQALSFFRITSYQFAAAVLLEFIVFIPFAYMAAEHGIYFFFIAINTLFLLHVLTHVGQSLFMRSYTPGVISAVVILLPYTLFLFNRLLSERLTTWTEIGLAVPVGLLIVPLVLAGHTLGKKLVD